MNRVISWKRLAIVAGILLGMGAATFGIHVVQVRRQADIFKSRRTKSPTRPTATPKRSAPPSNYSTLTSSSNRRMKKPSAALLN